MSALFDSGQIAVLLLVFTALEAAVLIALFRATGRGIPPARLLPTLGAGAGLLLATRLMLAGAWWGFSALCLLGALASHLTDLKLRWGGR